MVEGMHANLTTIRQIATHTHKSSDAKPKSEVAQMAWAFLAAAIHAFLECGLPSLTSGSSSA